MTIYELTYMHCEGEITGYTVCLSCFRAEFDPETDGGEVLSLERALHGEDCEYCGEESEDSDE
jgi:hypothetical protein